MLQTETLLRHEPVTRSLLVSVAIAAAAEQFTAVANWQQSF